MPRTRGQSTTRQVNFNLTDEVEFPTLSNENQQLNRKRKSTKKTKFVKSKTTKQSKSVPSTSRDASTDEHGESSDATAMGSDFS